MSEQGPFDFPEHHRMVSRGFGGTNLQTPLSERIATVKRYNNPQTALNNFANSQPVRIRLDIDDPLHSIVVMHRPGNPYGPVDSLVVAIDDSLRPETIGLQEVYGKYIYEMSPKAQKAYWTLALAQLKAAHESPHPEASWPQRFFIPRKDKEYVDAVFMENTTPLSYLDSRFADKTGISAATSQTILYPHGHIMVEDKRWLQPYDWSAEHLTREQTFIRKLQETKFGKELFVDMCLGINKKLLDVGLDIGDSIHPKLEIGEPVGYSFHFRKITSKNVMNHIQEVQAFMRAHFEMYQEEITKSSAKLRNKQDASLIGQPAYRDYLYFDNENRLVARFSPEILSFAGVTEAAGTEMVREPSAIDPISHKRVERYRKRWVRKVAQMARNTLEQETKMTVSRFRRGRNITFPKDEL